MKITINGEERTLENELSMSQLLDMLKISREALAVELNKNILPKSEYDSTELNDGDVLEIVQFVGGG